MSTCLDRRDVNGWVSLTHTASVRAETRAAATGWEGCANRVVTQCPARWSHVRNISKRQEAIRSAEIFHYECKFRLVVCSVQYSPRVSHRRRIQVLPEEQCQQHGM